MFDKFLLESKMHSTLFRIILNGALALIIFSLEEIGSFFGVKDLSLPISIFWPAAGFSLAAVILFGFETWPGILIGCFSYNFFHLFIEAGAVTAPFLVAFTISLGSLFQALLGGSIIRQLSSPGKFSTVKDIFLFLIPVGLITTMLASSVGVAALYYYQNLYSGTIIQTWLTFWLGDTIGVYVFTPLLVVWLTYKPPFKFRAYAFEASFMFAALVAIFLLSFVWEYFVELLFFPLIFWITYRFRMHGATLAILLIAVSTLISTYHGFGTIALNTVYNPLFYLIIFLEVLIATSLIFAAVINEREEAWNLLQNYSKGLQKTAKKHSSDLKETLNEVYIKEKLLSLGMLASGIGREIKVPLEGIEKFTTASFDCSKILQQSFSTIKENIDPAIALSMTNNFEILENCQRNILLYEKRANRIVDVIQEQAARTSPGRIEVKSINLHTLLIQCIDQLSKEKHKQYPEFPFTIIKEFDKAAAMVLGIPEDLAHAFVNILDNAFYSVKEKSQLYRNNYEPTVKISTIDLRDDIGIIFRDNGMGVPENRLPVFFESFTSTKPSGEATGIGLSLTYDIIVNEHHGEISVDSKENEYLELTLKLPKTLKRKKTVPAEELI